MKILHVSDIHYRESAENSDLLARAADQFAALHPDYILITGDLTRDGRAEQFVSVRRFIDGLDFCCVLAIPGNRDAARTAVATPGEYRDLEYYLATHPDPLSLLAELDEREQELHRARRADSFSEHFECAEFFYRDSRLAATGLHSAPEITAGQLELATRHFLSGHPGELRVFCAHHSFLPVPTKKLKPGDTVPRSADILQTLIELNVDLLCCGHIHRSHVWDLSDGRHRLLCCNAGSLLDTSGKKDNGYLEIEIEHDLRIVKRSLFASRTEVLYHRPHFGDILQARQQEQEAEKHTRAKKARSKK
ncbi:MAG TPA: metallophosphoesterase family protein [Ktedonobacteraceae bacterium]